MAANLIQTPDGVFRAKFNTDSDNWSVILPYVDRRKYTIGEKYTSWDTQGEFVFFKTSRNTEKWNWSFGLEILCDLDAYWVKPVEAGGGIFKNGEKLDDQVKTRLNFGDVFTVTKFRNDVSGGLANFTFRKREHPKTWDFLEKASDSDKEETELSLIPDRNKLIFSQILSHLSVPNLKNARLVCRYWDEEMTPILQRKSAMHFPNDWHPSACNPSLQYFRYIHGIRNPADWPNLKIALPKLPAKEDDPENWGNKYVTDLNWFLQPTRGHHVKTLSLSGEICSDSDYCLYLDTVSHFKDTLEELCVDLDIEICDKNGTNEKEYANRLGLFFPSLKKFALRIFTSSPELVTLTASWMTTWADAVTRVTSLSTGGDDFLGSSISKCEERMDEKVEGEDG